MLTDEDKLFGKTEKRQNTMIEKTIFTSACRYRVHTKGYDNYSIESGNLIKNIIPYRVQQELLNGKNEIEYDGIIIEKLTNLEPKKAEKKEELTEEKPKVKKTTTRKRVK